MCGFLAKSMGSKGNKESIVVAVERILDNYLEMNHHRKTPERYTILRAIYGINGHFTLVYILPLAPNLPPTRIIA